MGLATQIQKNKEVKERFRPDRERIEQEITAATEKLRLLNLQLNDVKEQEQAHMYGMSRYEFIAHLYDVNQIGLVESQVSDLIFDVTIIGYNLSIQTVLPDKTKVELWGTAYEMDYRYELRVNFGTGNFRKYQWFEIPKRHKKLAEEMQQIMHNNQIIAEE